MVDSLIPFLSYIIHTKNCVNHFCFRINSPTCYRFHQQAFQAEDFAMILVHVVGVSAFCSTAHDNLAMLEVLVQASWKNMEIKYLCQL